MIKKKLAPGIYVYSYSNFYAENIVDLVEKYIGDNFVKAQVVGENGEPIQPGVGGRDCYDFAITDLDIQSKDDESKAFFETIKKIITESLNDYKNTHALFEKLNDSAWIFLKYGRGQQFGSHIDDGPIYNRTISTTAYLNDDYTGGEICFPEFKVKYKPVKGDVLIFPSSYIYTHEVTPVVSGFRYAVVNWFRWFSLPENTNNIKDQNRNINVY